jgi:hypothetical protein
MKDRKQKNKLVYYGAIYGCISTALVYAGIGLIAILSFFKIKHGGADESSLMVYLDHYLVGRIFVGIILLGMLGYIIWNIYETIQDPYGYGNSAAGLGRRAGIALSSLADVLIALSATQALLGTGKAQENGVPVDKREMTATALQHGWGNELVIAIGAIIMIVAVVQMLYGITRGYVERMDIDNLKQGRRRLIDILAWMGYGARGVILGIIGFFFFKAGLSKDPRYVVNTDKAFDFIGDDVGHFWFLLVAAGTICYGVFMFLMGVNYDRDKD